MSKDDDGDDRPADDGAHDEDKVGHKRPPRQTRYRQGQSGNPSGRPKGARGRAAMLQEIAFETHTIIEDGKPRERTNLELVLLALRNHAAAATPRATRTYEKYQELFGPQDPLMPLGYILIPEAPPPEEWERICKERHDNMHEEIEKAKAEHEVRLAAWKAEHGKC